MNGASPEPALDPRPEILAEIRERGPMPFARYMDLCLYHPRWGYYTRGVGGGGGRDYLTSSGLHGVLGILVARQAEEMWRRLGRPKRFDFVEFGPGEGQFARDFLEAARGRAGFAASLRYVLVERSPSLAARQAARLATGSVAAASRTLEDLEREGSRAGCLFANEVLDAFPVHRVIGTRDGPREVHVTAAPAGRLEEILLPLSDGTVFRFLEEAGIALEDGQEVDLNLEAALFVKRVARLLSRGYLILVDYGYEARELYDPARRRGTLRAYYHHRINEEFLLRPGDQDLTAHLDFTSLRKAGHAAGARCLGLTTQSRFLLALGALDLLPDPDGKEAPPARDGRRPSGGARAADWLARFGQREALKEVVLPGRMGERFQVMILGVGNPPDDLTGLADPWTVQGAGGSATRPMSGRAPMSLGEQR